MTTTNPTPEPRPVCMKLCAWPSADRDAWEAAIRLIHPLDPPGPASGLSTGTRRMMVAVYGQYLSWLDANNELREKAHPNERVTPCLLGRFLIARRQMTSDNTVFNNLRMLGMMMKCLVPEKDWSWVARHPAGPRRSEAKSARKVIRAFDPATLYRHVLSKLSGFESTPPSFDLALTRRNHLIVGVALLTMLRMRNLHGIRLSKNMVRREHRWELAFGADETKTNSPLVVHVPATLTKHLDRYLEIDRPLLLGGGTCDALWLTRFGEALTDQSVRFVFMQTTETLIGVRLNPHSVRHAAATALLLHDPNAVEVASSALGHDDSRTVTRFYDQSGSTAAQAVWRSVLSKYRNK